MRICTGAAVARTWRARLQRMGAAQRTADLHEHWAVCMYGWRKGGSNIRVCVVACMHMCMYTHTSPQCLHLCVFVRMMYKHTNANTRRCTCTVPNTGAPCTQDSECLGKGQCLTNSTYAQEMRARAASPDDVEDVRGSDGVRKVLSVCACMCTCM
jgi:hypothetical protein